MNIEEYVVGKDVLFIDESGKGQLRSGKVVRFERLGASKTPLPIVKVDHSDEELLVGGIMLPYSGLNHAVLVNMLQHNSHATVNKFLMELVQLMTNVRAVK